MAEFLMSLAVDDGVNKKSQLKGGRRPTRENDSISRAVFNVLGEAAFNPLQDKY